MAKPGRQAVPSVYLFRHNQIEILLQEINKLCQEHANQQEQPFEYDGHQEEFFDGRTTVSGLPRRPLNLSFVGGL